MIKVLRRAVPPLLTLCAVFLMSSCLENYSEEMVIHTDLSGEATVTVKLPDTLVSKFDAVQAEFAPDKIKKRFAGLSGVTLQSYTLGDGRNPEAVFKISFSSLDKLSAAAAANKPAQILVGEWKVSTNGKGERVIERQLGKGAVTAEISPTGYALYKMHFDQPVEVVGTNSEYKDSSRGDVRYRWSIAEVMSEQPLIENRTSKPWPWVWILGSAMGLLIVTWIAWLQLGNIKRKRKLATSVPRVVPGPAGSPPPSTTPQQPQRPGPPRRPGPPPR